MSVDTTVGTETKAVAPVIEAVPVASDNESVANTEAMAIAQETAESAPAEKESMPSFFMEKDIKHRVELDVLTAKADGAIMSVSRKGLGINFGEFSYLRLTSVWFDFTIPTYEEMINYRARAGNWNREAQQIIVDRVQLRNFFLVWHLKEWSLTDKDGKPVKLEHDKEGSLNDLSVKKVYSTHPTILDIALTVFEKDILFA